MIWCSSWTPTRSISPRSRRGRLAWKVESLHVKMEKTKFLVMAMMSLRNLASTPVLSAVIVLAEIPPCAHSVCCEYTRRAVGLLSDCSKTQAISAPPPPPPPPGVRVIWQAVTEGNVDVTMLPRWYAVLRWGLWQSHCCKMLCGQGKVKKTLACPNHQTPLTRIHRNVYEAYVGSPMAHGNEKCGPKEPESRQLSLNYRAMIQWICGIKYMDETPSSSLFQKLGIDDITLVFHCRQLREYDRVKRTTSCIKSITDFPLPVSRKKGRPQKTWSECGKTDVDMCGIVAVDPLDRDARKAGVRHCLV